MAVFMMSWLSIVITLYNVGTTLTLSFTMLDLQIYTLHYNYTTLGLQRVRGGEKVQVNNNNNV